MPKWCVAQTAAADCVALGINVDDVQRSVRRRGTTRVRLSNNVRVLVVVNKRVIVRVRPAVKITNEAAAECARLKIETADVLKLLATARKSGGVHTNATGLEVTVKPELGGEVIVSVRKRDNQGIQ